mgnify:CR=1 FL=1
MSPVTRGAVLSKIAETVVTPEIFPEESFASEHGYGGKCDLVCKTADGFVADIKTKEFTDPDNVKGYDEHLMQLAAYRIGFNLPKARCANIFVSVNSPVIVKIIEWSEEDLQKGWKMFQSLLTYWKLKNNFGEINA